MTNIARSLWASVRCPHWLNRRLKPSCCAEPLVELDRCVVEPRALGRLVVRAQDRRVTPGGARADVALLEHGDVGDPVLAQVVRRRQSVRAAADDDHVVAPLEIAGAAPHAARAEEVTHAPRPAQRYSAYAAPVSRRKLCGRLAQDKTGRPRDRAGPERADRRGRIAQVKRAEARDPLARAGPGHAQRGELAGDVEAAHARGRRRGAEDERPARRDEAPPGVVAAERGAELQPERREVAAELELREQRARRPRAARARRAGCGPAARPARRPAPGT